MNDGDKDKLIYLTREKIKDENLKIDLTEIIKESNSFDLNKSPRYKMVNAIVPSLFGDREEKYYVIDRGAPVFQINEWLDTKNEKLNTGKKYANILTRFLNYLDEVNKKYWQVSNNDIEDYILYRMYGGKDNITLIKSKIRYKTINDDVMVLKQFYNWLSQRIKRISIKAQKKKMINKYSYLFAEIGETDYESIIEKRLDSMADTKKYLKWYTQEQVNAMVSQFTTLRDKAIFLCTVDAGMRIDEVLSLKVMEYDSNENTIVPSRSKSKSLRTIKLSKSTCDVINNYMLAERATAECEANTFCEYMFINLRKGEMQGKAMSYNNFYRILKRYAEKAGFPVEQIRTHSGRSTKAMEYLEVQALYSEDNLTDAQIMESMGWTNMKSLEPYRNHKNKVIAKLAQEKIQNRKLGEKKDED